MPFIGKKDALHIAQKLKVEIIHNMAVAEGSQLSFAETKTLIENGITSNSCSTFDVEQALRLNRAFDEIIHQIQHNTFVLNKDNFIKINQLIAENEALNVGSFRYSQVSVGDYMPPRCEELDTLFIKMIDDFNHKSDSEEKASDLFLDSARNQYFFDGNKRTAQMMMNGFLISNGYCPRTIQRENINEYNQKMYAFYPTNDKKAMYEFLEKIASKAVYI
ncbi:MAG: Fic family protein [Gammaproteobacteria bacterium]|nr:Fic family protein [Gammaproteobacteria bacterium]